jgi:serralysin
MGRPVLLLASGAFAVLLASGVAFAAVVDCEAGELLCSGTIRDDTLNGSEDREKLFGLAGNDAMFGNGGDDDLVGNRGADTMRGGEGRDYARDETQGPDKIYGEGGVDYLGDSSYRCTKRRGCVDDKNLLDGGDGDDQLSGQNRLYGGPGDDALSADGLRRTPTTLDGGPGLDTMEGGASPDTIYAQDGEIDEISCGGNKDTVYHDAGVDVVDPATCERRITQPAP